MDTIDILLAEYFVATKNKDDTLTPAEIVRILGA